MNVLKNGHHPNLIGKVPDYEIKNNGSFHKHTEFAIKEVKRLIELGKVEVLSYKPKCVNPLHVVVQRTKSRLILDCTVLNKFIEVPKIKYEDYRTALNFFQ